jgi:hypothetical protein
MRDQPFLLLLYGCQVADISGREPQRVMRIVERLNMTLDDEDKLRLLGNLDSTRGYLGLPLATSHPELARTLHLPLMSAYFTVALDTVATWLQDLVPSDRVQRAETQWTRLRRASSTSMSPELASDIPAGRLLFIQDQDTAHRSDIFLRLR